jgi:hypothetical protein
MTIRRIAVFLTLVAVVAVACTEEDDSAGIRVERPIGAPATAPTDHDASRAALPSGSPVVKSGVVHAEVAQDRLGARAQAVVDLAVSPRIGGFVVSSLLDFEDGYGSATIVVRVPAPRFEEVVSELGDVGDVKRQELEGQDLSPESLGAHARVQEARRQTSRVIDRLERTEDPAARSVLRDSLRALGERLEALQQDEAYVEAVTAYSTIEVLLTAAAPPPAPEKPAVERALATAQDIAVTIASMAVLAAGVVVPVGLLLLILYLVGAPIIRRLKPRLET